MNIKYQTELQDVYQLKEGIVFVINKFDYIPYKHTIEVPRGKYKRLNKLSKDNLFMLTKEITYEKDYDEGQDSVLPVGTLVHNNKLIYKLDNPRLYWGHMRIVWGCSASLGYFQDFVNGMQEVINIYDIENPKFKITYGGIN